MSLVEFLNLLNRMAFKKDPGQFLLGKLATVPVQRNEFMQEARSFFEQLITAIVVVLKCRSTSKGASNFSILWLSGRTVNDLVSAFHLAQCGYNAQAYSLLRSAYEALDLIDLFHRFPKDADIWTEEYTKKNKILFQPSGVRERLHKPKYDPLYSMFCGYGSHPRFEGRHANSYMLGNKGTKTIKFILGGLCTLKDLYRTHLYALLLAARLLKALWEHFDRKEKTDSQENYLLQRLVKFVQRHVDDASKLLSKEDDWEKHESLLRRELQNFKRDLTELQKN